LYIGYSNLSRQIFRGVFSGRRAELAESEEEPNVYTTLSELNYFCDQMELIARKGLPS
jgi:hypothetical protein